MQKSVLGVMAPHALKSSPATPRASRACGAAPLAKFTF
jgi:hypothetical protein